MLAGFREAAILAARPRLMGFRADEPLVERVFQAAAFTVRIACETALRVIEASCVDPGAR